MTGRLALAFLCGLILPALPAGGSTPLPPDITADTVLTLADSPYLAEGRVHIHPQVTLSVEAGVEILFLEEGEIFIDGALLCEGLPGVPISFRPDGSATLWRALTFHYSAQRSELRHVIIDRATASSEHWIYKAALNSFYTEILVENVTFQNCVHGIYANNSVITIRDCDFPPGNSGEHVNAFGGSLLMEGCHLAGGGSGFDSIDLDWVYEAIISDCVIVDSPDEGLDMGGAIALVIDCIFDGCYETGITAGETSELTSIRNIISNSPRGIVVSESSNALIDHNSFYNNAWAIRVEERITGWGGASAEICNCIMSQSSNEDVYIDELSAAEITYCLSDTELLPGEGNLLGDPLFVYPSAGDFHLQAESPCIDAGHPDYPPDTDGTRSDMGALYYHQATAAPSSFPPGSLILAAPHPNPGRSGSTLRCYLPRAEPAELGIYDVRGRCVWRRSLSPGRAGWSCCRWQCLGPDGSSLAAGVYLALLRQGEQEARAKLVILR